MLLAILTAQFKSSFRTETCEVHITDKQVKSKNKIDVWTYCMEIPGIIPSTVNIQYSPYFNDDLKNECELNGHEIAMGIGE